MDDEEVEQESGVKVFGIEVADMDSNIHPLDCLILIKGVNMSDGEPTMTSIGSESLTPWEAMGMMQMEIERIKAFALFNAVQRSADDD